MSQDISRLLRQPLKHYAGARLQQGRVLLDSDFNEASWFEEEDARRAWLDVIGPEGSPDQGFTIGHPFPLSPPEILEQTEILRPEDRLDAEDVSVDDSPADEVLVYNVTVRPGRMFLGGQRFELERAEPIMFQRDFLQATVGENLAQIPPASEEDVELRHLYYLHAWEQTVSAVEDQEIAEAMLRGPDTSVRLRRMRRVEVLPFDTEVESCTEAFGRPNGLVAALEAEGTSEFDDTSFELKSNARLQLVFKAGDSADPCGPCNPDPQYLGAENATLRIMLADPSHFVWAFDNGTALHRITLTDLGASGGATAVVEMLTPPAREEDLPVANRVVEILPFAALLDGGDLPAEQLATNPHFRKLAAEVGVFAKVTTSYDRDTGKFTLNLDAAQADAIRALISVWHSRHPDAAVLNVGNDDPDTRHFYMRLWHQVPAASSNIALPIDDDPNGNTLGDTGIVPVFTHAGSPGATAIGRPGDFWIATLRTTDPGRIVPYELMQTGGLAPDGPRHYYTPLALLHVSEGVIPGTEDTALFVEENGDCRSRLRRVGDLGCFTCTVGDGVTSSGDFLSIQDAIESLPSSGGRIGIRPGVYDEQIVIDGRRDVILEGCGASTVIETPDFLPSGPLVEVRDCLDVTLSGLTLRAVGQTALAVRRVTDLTLTELHASAATIALEETTIPAGALSTAPVIDIAQVGSADLRSLTLRPAQRPGLVLAQSELVSLREIEASGEATSLFPPTAPLITIADCELVRLDGARLEAFGQVGVAVRGASRDVELRGLTVRCSSNTADFPNERGFQAAQELLAGEAPDPESPVSPDPRSDTEDEERFDAEEDDEERLVVSETQSGVDIDNGEGIRLARSHIRLDGSRVSEHAAVVARGRDVVIEDNTIESLFDCHDSPEQSLLLCDDLRAAFGGLQIRGGSDGVEIRRNRIQGGLGHGITLGSVLWHVAGATPQSARRIGGAGTGQLVPLSATESTRIVLGRNVGGGFEDDDGNEFLPRSEGRIRDLVIADNRIKEMFASGISALTVLGLLNRGGEFIEIESARIEGNAIEGNLVRPGRDLPDIGDIMPFPASLSGPSVISVLPFGGIVLGTVTGGLDILNNVIRDNAIGTVSKGLPINGVFVLNGEGLNISGNRVINNGVRILQADTTVRLRPGVRAGIAVMLAGTGATNDIGELRYFVGGRGTLSSSNSSLRVADNTVLQPEGRALHAVATGPMTVDGNFLSSQGHHGSNLSVDRFAVGDAVFVQNLGAPWEQSELDSVVTLTGEAPGTPTVPGFVIAQKALNHLLNNEEDSPRLYIGDGGNILFNNNQVVYDWDVQRVAPSRLPTPLSFFPVVVLGLDHVGVNGNQFGLRVDLGSLPQPPAPLKVAGAPALPPEILMVANLFVLGGTVEVTRNRSAEQVGSTLLSLLTSAEIMNTTALNQTTNYNLVLSQLDRDIAPSSFLFPELQFSSSGRVNHHNQVIFFRTDPGRASPLPATSPAPPTNVRTALKKAIRGTFVRLLRRRTR